MKLSDTFRYVLHEGQSDSVYLIKEITHLQDYCSLQKDRLLNKLNIEFLVDIDNPQQAIAPLLLISFVENAFKHTSLLRGYGHFVKLNIELKNGALCFYCENPFIEDADESIDSDWSESGIGISNTRKRLEYLYPNSHQLCIVNNDGIFKVTLIIQL